MKKKKKRYKRNWIDLFPIKNKPVQIINER